MDREEQSAGEDRNSSEGVGESQRNYINSSDLSMAKNISETEAPLRVGLFPFITTPPSILRG